MKENLKELLAHRRKQCIVDSSRIAAAVLIPIYVRDGQHHIVFIRRTETVKDHKGQISFPGGMREPDDQTLQNTALRESHEEIGLLAEDVEVVGELDDEITTTSNYIVTPFVGFIPWPYNFRHNADEVAEIIEIPLAALREDGCCREDIEILDGQTVESCAYHYGGRIIWGATARILYKLLGIIERAL